MRKIPFFNYQALKGNDPEGLMAVIRDVVDRGAFILQKDLEAFEQAAAQFLDVPHVIGVADGTNAIILLLHAAGIQPGDELIVPSHTYVATVNAMQMIGAIPVLVECGRDRLIDTSSIEKAITAKTKAIVPVQLNGRIADMDAIAAIAEKENLLVLEDAAQAFGSRYKGQSVGTSSLGATISYYPAKVLGCFGDGGAVITRHDAVAKTVKEWRDHGRNESGEVVSIGTNARLDNLQAAILLHKLKEFPAEIEKRRTLAATYHAGLSELSELELPLGPEEDKDRFDIYQNYEITAERRDALRSYLSEQGIGSIIQWGGKAIHQIEALGYGGVSLPYTESFFEKCMLLPMNPSLSVEDVEYISEKIRAFYKQ